MVKEKKEKEIKKGNTATEIGNVPLKFPKSSHPFWQKLKTATAVEIGNVPWKFPKSCSHVHSK
jgi:hypothetical protein